jgi:hypothetical protein
MLGKQLLLEGDVMSRVSNQAVLRKEGRVWLNWHTVGVRFLSVIIPGAALTMWVGCIQIFGCGLSGDGGLKVISGIEELFKFICGGERLGIIGRQGI